MEALLDEGVEGGGSPGAGDRLLSPARRPPLDGVFDDFSLQSQGIRFRALGREMRIYERRGGQLILEEGGDGAPDDGGLGTRSLRDADGFGRGGILVKTTEDRSYGFVFLRAAYGLMATFVAGFLFVLGLCTLLFLFISLATTMGLTGDGMFNPGDFLGVLLTIPVFIYSMAMGMTLVGRFVADTFNGHPFFRSFGLGVATTDWIAFVLYIGIPILTFIATLFSKMDNWWEISLLTWFYSILIFWCLFAACVLCLEAWACLTLMEEYDGNSLIDDDPWKARALYWLRRAGEVCLRTMRYRLSGTSINFKEVDAMSNITKKVTQYNCASCMTEYRAPCSHLAGRLGHPWFVQRPPERIHTLDEALGNVYFVTRHSWSLEKLFCRRGGLYASIPITQGESSITEAQINSNIACSILGNVIYVLLFASFVVWFGLPPFALGILTFIAIIIFACVGVTTCRMIALRNDIVNDENPVLYRYWEMYQHSSPKDGFIWAVVASQAVFLYLLPLIYLCYRNPQVATMFAILGACSGVRHYLSVRILLLENKDYFRITLEDQSRRDRNSWGRKAIIYHLAAVGGDKARRFWTVTYLLFTLFFAAVAIAATNEHLLLQEQTTTTPSQEPLTFLDGFEYQPQPNLPYPTCRLKKGFGGVEIEMADAAFVSKLAYAKSNDLVSRALDEWFGPGVATNNVALIEEFKTSEYYKDFGFISAASYKVFTFPDGAVLTIRGTQSAWDLIADAQLWLPATLFQVLRFVLPLSQLWTPILHHMVSIVSHLESDTIDRVAFYRETKRFAEYLKKEKGYEVVVTGHSLGGGLAIITGAESETMAIAISGPNAVLSRDSFIPPVTVEQLDRLTFNVVPARDLIPNLDDKARLYQNINCTAEMNDLFGCHAVTRSLCEIQYTCGSADRPVLCECALDYGYPAPTPKDMTQTTETRRAFFQTCADICIESGGSSEKCARWKDNYFHNQGPWSATT